MSDINECLFCGKPIVKDDKICEDCKNHVEHQYEIDLLVEENEVQKQAGDILSVETELELPLEDLQALEDVLEKPTTPVNKHRSKMSRGMVFLIIGSVILIAIGVYGALDIAETRKSLEAQDNYWNNCVQENTALSYSKYLIRYPEGVFASEAENRIRELRNTEVRAWEELQKSTDINDFYAYLSENPQTPHLGRIHMIMDSLSWSATLKDNTADAYKAYLENVQLGNFTGYYVDEAESRYEYLSEITVVSGGELESLKIDLLDFFQKMTENKPKNLLKEFSPTVYYYTSEMTSTALVASIAKKYDEEKIKKITYTLQPESIFAKRDNKGVVFVDLTIEKVVDYSTKKKKDETITQKLSIEFNDQKLVQSIKTISKK